MKPKPPLPTCQGFLPFLKVIDSPNGEPTLVAMLRGVKKAEYPAAMEITFVARLKSGHGHYQVEIQMQAPDGHIYWRQGPPNPWAIDQPLTYYDLKISCLAAFPRPGAYDFVLMMNGDEISRHNFYAELTPPTEAIPHKPENAR